LLGKHKILLLLPEYDWACYVIRDSVVALGQNTGRVIFVELSRLQRTGSSGKSSSLSYSDMAVVGPSALSAGDLPSDR
jgi:hypothetical protein